MTTETKLPKWFDGKLYSEGDTVRNPYSGETYELTAEELSMYDFIIGADQLAELGMLAFKNQDDMRKGLTWFRKNNPDAYYVLLD